VAFNPDKFLEDFKKEVETKPAFQIDEAALIAESKVIQSIPIPEIGEDEVIQGQLEGNEDLDLSVLLVKNFKNPKDHRCISVDGLILSEQQLPVFYHKSLETELLAIAKLYNKSLTHRGDKALEKLMALGFTSQHKVLIAYKKKKSNKLPKLGSVENMKANFNSQVERELKYIVIPRKYLDKIPADIYKEFSMSLTILESEIDKIRIKEEKKKPLAGNSYYVVNQDEPYAHLIWQRIVAGEMEKLKQLKKQKEK
jgi:hypothetical protein